MLRRWGKTRRGELADAGGAGTAAGTHGVVAQRRSRLLAPLSHELGGVVAEQEAARAARRRARHRSGVDRLGVVVATRALAAHTTNQEKVHKRCSKRISGNQIGSNFFFAHVKMCDVALQLLQNNLESELYRSYTERVRGVG